MVRGYVLVECVLIVKGNKMKITETCMVCDNPTEVYLNVGYIRQHSYGHFMVIPKDRLDVWDEMNKRIVEMSDYSTAAMHNKELWIEFKDCVIRHWNSVKVLIEE